jgi:hypothetical protein
MEPLKLQETVVPTDRTLEEVLSAAGAVLDQQNFARAANAAENVAVKSGVTLIDQWKVFDSELVANCKLFGDDIPRRFIEIIHSGAVYLEWWGAPGARLEYVSKATDGNVYIAYVYP